MLTAEQLYGARFLAERRVAMLADRVGFGKTAQVVRACDLINAQRITVLCPPILRTNEVRQFEQWGLFGYDAHAIRTGKDRVPDAGLVVCSYDLARTDRIRKLLTRRGCDVLVLDEAHRAKTPRSKTTRSIFNKAGIASTAARVWFVTGEPTPNHAGEFYVFAKVAGAWSGTYDGEKDGWIQRFCIVQETDFGPQIRGTKEETRAELKALLRPHMLQRDGVDPERAPLTEDAVYVDAELPPMSAADAMALERISNAIAAGDLSLLDDPFVATMRRLAGVAKAKAVAELALETNAPTLIFCQHTDVIDTIAGLTDARVIDGRTPQRERQDVIDAFQEGAVRRIVAHIKAAGEGLTLTAATRVLLAEPSWSPAENTQAIARAWRRGQSRPVHASFVYIPGTIDDAVAGALKRKSADISNLRMQLT